MPPRIDRPGRGERRMGKINCPRCGGECWDREPNPDPEKVYVCPYCNKHFRVRPIPL